MATIRKFEDLEIWRLAREINIKIIPYLKILAEKRDFELKNQLDRSAGSVMDNIAEGFERDGNREFIQFLAYSKASLGEVRSQIYRLFDRELMDKKTFEISQNDCLLLAGKIGTFMTYLRNSGFRGNKFKDSHK
jgi:four helix bundle protein